MQTVRRGVSRYLLAALLSSFVYTVAFVVEQYVFVFLFDSYDMGYGLYIFEALLFGLPPFFLAFITAFIAYGLLLKRTSDTECCCRNCGYILKGLSEPRCSECGEMI